MGTGQTPDWVYALLDFVYASGVVALLVGLAFWVAVAGGAPAIEVAALGDDDQDDADEEPDLDWWDRLEEQYERDRRYELERGDHW